MDLKRFPSRAGIYKLTCKINGKIYIGKSVNINRRMGNYRRYDKSIGIYFKSALLKHGWDSFDVEILEAFENFDKQNEKDNKFLLDMETSYIELFDSTNREIGYNLCKFSNDSTGIRFSEETRLKMSIAQRGKKMSEESKIKISQSNKDKPKSKDHAAKCRVASLGHKHSEETKEKIRQGNKGKKLSEEHRQKLIEANKNRLITEETREKMRNSQIGKSNASGKRSEESKQRMRESRLSYLEKQKSII